MRKLRIGRRRGRGDEVALSPLELALYPALADARWNVPDSFNFSRDVAEALADDPKRRAVTFIGKDGIIEPRTFLQVSERSARWSWLLRERGVRPGDPVLVLAGTNVDWLEVVLACLKVGAVVVPGSPHVTAETLDVRVERTGAELIVAEPSVEPEIARMVERPQVLYVDEGRGLLDTVAEHAPTHDTSARDLAFVLSTAGTSGTPKPVGHSHGSVFASRVAAEHWLDAGRGDAVWAPADPGSFVSILYALIGPWSRGAETLLHDGPFDALERLDLIYRLGVTVLCQSPAEYAALAELREVTRFQPPQLRRLVSTGDQLDPEVSRVFEEAWGLTIHDGYGQVETGIVVANSGEAGFRPGSLGYPLPGHQVAVVDDQGNELPPGVEGELAVRGRPPTLFAGYWESPEETKQAFRGDWYATGDIATVDDDGFFWFVGRSADMITSRGESFGPHETERALRAHDSVSAAAVVGVRDLERGGQFVRAFVVPAAGVTTSEQLEAELRHEVGQVLPDHAVPREIEFVDELPTAPGGKIRRLELRERLVVGRPLWDLPPTTDGDDEPDPWAGMLEPWPADGGTASSSAPPAVDEAGEPLPDYIVPPEPEPEPETVHPVAEVLAEPIAAPEPPPEPVLEPLPDYDLGGPAEPEAVVDVEHAAPRAETAPRAQPEPAEPEQPSRPQPAPEEPGGQALSRPPEWSVPLPNWGARPQDDPPEPMPAESAPEPAPEPAADPEPEHVAEFEPVAELRAEPLPAEPIQTEAQPVAPEPPPEPEADAAEEEATQPALEAVPDPEPESTATIDAPAAEALVETTPPVPEAAPEPESKPEPEQRGVVWTPLPSLEPVREPEPEAPFEAVWSPVPSIGPGEPEQAEIVPEPDAEPTNEAETEPTHAAEPILEPEAEVEADVEPELEADPVADLVIEPESAPRPPEIVADPLADEPVEHGPLPDYIVDPDRGEDPPSGPVVQPDPPAETWPSAGFPESTHAISEPPEPALENLGLPPLSEFPGISRDAPEAPRPQERGRAPEAKGRPAPQPKRRGRRRKAAEPGDEVEPTTWMDGLSSRLSAYSLTGEEMPEGKAEPDDSGAADEASETDEQRAE